MIEHRGSNEMEDFVNVALDWHACCASIFSATNESEPLGPSLQTDQTCGHELHAAGPPLAT